MRDEVVIEVKNNIRALSALKKTGKTVGALKFESDHKRIHLRQYRVTHEITGQNTIRIQGLSHEVRVAGLRQLRTLDKVGIEYEITTADIIKRDDDFYINITVFVDKDVWLRYQNEKRNKRNTKRKNLVIHKINALDMGCLKTATDAYGRVYNSTVEETERLRRLQRKLQRQKKGSNNRKKTLKQLHKEYERNDNLKEQHAIELVNEVLDTSEVLIIQDENLSGWKKKHGKKVQHGILGRVKQRLMQSDRVHVIDRFVPTTKLCTNCGHMHSAITVRERTFVCPHCGHNDGERDQHSAKDMIWLYQNLKEYIGLDGSEFKRCEFDEALK